MAPHPPHNLRDWVRLIARSQPAIRASYIQKKKKKNTPAPDFPTAVCLHPLPFAKLMHRPRIRPCARARNVKATSAASLEHHRDRAPLHVKGALARAHRRVVERQAIDGISDLRDESDAAGCHRIGSSATRSPSGAEPLSNNAEQDSFGFNSSRSGWSPKLLTLKDALPVFIDTASGVVTLRTVFSCSRHASGCHPMV